MGRCLAQDTPLLSMGAFVPLGKSGCDVRVLLRFVILATYTACRVGFLTKEGSVAAFKAVSALG